MGYCLLMEKTQNTSYKDWQRLKVKEIFLVYPTKFFSNKKKTYDSNDLLALSLVSAIAFILFEKKILLHMFKNNSMGWYYLTQNLLTRKCANNLWKMEKKKNHVRNFSTLSINDMKTEKKYKSVLLVWIYSTKTKTQQYVHNRPKGSQLY